MLERAFIKPKEGIVQQAAALRAHLTAGVRVAAVERNHDGDGAAFPGDTRVHVHAINSSTMEKRTYL